MCVGGGGWVCCLEQQTPEAGLVATAGSAKQDMLADRSKPLWLWAHYTCVYVAVSRAHSLHLTQRHTHEFDATNNHTRRHGVSTVRHK